ncbi:cytochrome c oxidase subunit 5A, mitochondrial-like, partial [Anoplophora glabripennis]|uniref:cytochrome c oxidase subunit 5A, mitochondrial-like n=1 Tax=Anoplophora glabripennis TaxID=217634 RepID=UPI000875A782
YECLFNRDDADGWDVRQAMNDLTGYDAVPDPKVIIAALNACRRINEYALAVRFLEMVKNKCGHDVEKIYPYIIQEVGGTVAELGCDFPESLGYDKPELWMQSVFDM